MLPIRNSSGYSLVIILVIMSTAYFQGLKFNYYKSHTFGYELFAIDQTVTSTTTPSVTVTQTEMVTGTAIASVTDETPTLSPTATSTINETLQPTATTTALPSNTATSIPSSTITNTPDRTDTPEPTSTLIPLPSITLLFPAETATPLLNETQVAESSQGLNSTNSSGDVGTRIVTAQSILLIGTIILLWVILGMFVIFYINKMSD